MRPLRAAEGAIPSSDLAASEPAPSQLVDRRAAMPLWMQVKQSLTAMIRDEGLADHHRLPSEAALCKLYGVSRTVVREALAQMVNEELIYRHQGKGAFVRGRREVQSFVGSTVGFSGELTDRQQSVTRQMLRQEVAMPTHRMQRLLKVGPSEPVVVVDRVMSVDGVPRAIVRWAMIERVVPGLVRLPINNRSLYDTISRQYGIRLIQAERWIEAVSLSAEDAALLDVEEGKAALCIESVGSNDSQMPIEYYQAHYLSDRARLRFIVSSGA